MTRKNKSVVNPFDIINEELNGKTTAVTAPSVKSTSPPSAASEESVSQKASPAAQSEKKESPQKASATDTKNKTDKPAQTVSAANPNSTSPSENTGGSLPANIFKGILIVLLALVLAWIIFMPSGSLFELKDHMLHSISEQASNLRFHQNTAPSTTSAIATTATKATTPGTSQATSTTTATTTTTTTTTTTAATTTTIATTKLTTTAAAVTTTTTAAQEDPAFGNEQGAIYVYLKSQTVVVYKTDGTVRKAFTCSSGKAATPTKTGDYSIRSKYRWRLMIGNCYTQYASSFSSGYLFHSIPYNRRNAATMSDASYDKLGTPASSGCIRLCFRDSKWIYDNCPIGTFVRVIDEEAPAGIVPLPIPPRNTDAAYSGWDPTDTAPNNPYNQ
ncbi:MAG: L,D-transpeptidase family protein [Clostridia bacterium]|nr:L,D-transpeptidase family protein [Clostridia bacterium]